MWKGCLAQNGKLALGLDCGFGRLQYQPLYAHLDGANFISYLSATTPKNFRGLMELALKPKTRLRLAAGYGSGQTHYHESRLDYETGISGHPPQRITAATEIRVSGLLVESTLLWQLPIRFPKDEQRRLSVHAGAGLGFYSYLFKAGGWWQQRSDSLNAAEDFRRDLSLPDSQIRGLSQFLLLAVDFRVLSNAALTFEYSRKGFFDLRLVRAKFSNEAERTTHVRDKYHSRINFDHDGFTLGLKWNFGKV